MANSKDGQGHNEKYLDTNKKISSQEMLMFDIYHFVLTDSITFFKIVSQVLRSKGLVLTKRKYSCEI